MGFFILGVVIGLVVCFFAALEFASIASEKGYDDSKYFWYTFLLGIIGMLMVTALPDRGINYNAVHKNMDKMNSFENEQNSYEISSNMYDGKKEFEKIEVETNFDVKNEKDIPAKAILKDGQKICPVCGKVQNSDRKKCWDCGQIFEE